jgi:hypothetical protein
VPWTSRRGSFYRRWHRTTAPPVPIRLDVAPSHAKGAAPRISCANRRTSIEGANCSEDECTGSNDRRKLSKYRTAPPFGHANRNISNATDFAVTRESAVEGLFYSAPAEGSRVSHARFEYCCAALRTWAVDTNFTVTPEPEPVWLQLCCVPLAKKMAPRNRGAIKKF